MRGGQIASHTVEDPQNFENFGTVFIKKIESFREREFLLLRDLLGEPSLAKVVLTQWFRCLF